MTRKYILTGGPGTGKSSIILALEKLGEYTIRESAEDYIKLRQAQGQPTPWIESNFQLEILKLQRQRESRIPREIKRVFIDRGLADGLAYATPGSETYKEIERAAKQNRYDGIFSIENLGSTEKNGVRRENNEEALRLGRKLEDIYQTLGYKIIRVPAIGINERTKLILKNLEEKFGDKK